MFLEHKILFIFFHKKDQNSIGIGNSNQNTFMIERINNYVGNTKKL